MSEPGSKILVVDDTLSIRKMLNLYLTRSGHKVEEADNGQRALEVMRTFQPDLMILDIAMPIMNGLETLEKVREFDSILPVIMVTANDSKENIRKALHSGAFAFISKPVKFEELERLIHDGLRRREIADLKQKIAESSRFIAVGEMAGQVAHEVLNPITAVMTRIEEMVETTPSPEESGLHLISEVVTTWQDHHQRSDLIDYLMRPSGFTAGRTCADEDFGDLLNIVSEYIERENNYRENMLFLQKAIMRIIKIVDSLRRLSRTNSNMAVISINAVVNETLELLNDQIRKRNIEVVRNLDLNIPEVYADFDEMIQVITNLTKNAMQAIDKNRKPGILKFDTGYKNDRIELRITDNGTGIPLELQKINFDRTFTTKDASEGTGLGLGISRRIVRKFHGDVQLEWSEVGQGTRFLIWLAPYTGEARPEAGDVNLTSE